MHTLKISFRGCETIEEQTMTYKILCFTITHTKITVQIIELPYLKSTPSKQEVIISTHPIDSGVKKNS